ncbi:MULTISPECIES: guanylate kinase [Paenibacillus]|uniref:Guanylate kinase n=1 Tax=Paenibacillus radicis (ex Xue et al. 2023) TaxID=2972489 RepID=A0ABT1YKN2_9BACL|nr:guanylate kinase [Paenibacillus radicis (ex Xue et al. 2023)]MCR8633754.1 guanylate kinase [Paenibacillus radicis (ex Xue et al. 2023)]
MNGNFENGTIFVFVGTSGSGRKTIAHQIGKELGFQFVISHTTRDPRPRETHGKDYYFTSRKEFIEADIRGEFIQTVELDNHFYGIKKADITAALKASPVIYVIVNRSGANKLKYEFGDKAIRLFIYVNKQLIQERLQAKAVSDEIIRHYMDHYIEEVSYRKDCEHVFENLDLDETKARIKHSILAHLPATTS